MRHDDTSYTVDIAAEEDVTFTTQFIGTRNGFNRESQPFVDAKGETLDHASRMYSDEIGVVLKETTEEPAVYVSPATKSTCARKSSAVRIRKTVCKKATKKSPGASPSA